MGCRCKCTHMQSEHSCSTEDSYTACNGSLRTRSCNVEITVVARDAIPWWTVNLSGALYWREAIRIHERSIICQDQSYKEHSWNKAGTCKNVEDLCSSHISVVSILTMCPKVAAQCCIYIQGKGQGVQSSTYIGQNARLTWLRKAWCYSGSCDTFPSDISSCAHRRILSAARQDKSRAHLAVRATHE